MKNKNEVSANYDNEVTYIPGMTFEASDRNLKRRKKLSCTGKKKFQKEKTARIKALLYDLKYYQCGFCKKWHLTKDAKNSKER